MAAPCPATPRTTQAVASAAGDIVNPKLLAPTTTWVANASPSERSRFENVFTRIHEHSKATGGGSGSTRVTRSGLLGNSRTLRSQGSTHERSTYSNDFREYDSPARRAIIPQNKHTRLDDFDQRVPPSTYLDDFKDHNASTRRADRLAANPELVASSKTAALRAIAHGPPQSMYGTDFVHFSRAEATVARAKSVRPLHGRQTAKRPEDADVRRFLLSSIYQSDFVEHEDRNDELLAEAAAAEAAADAASAGHVDPLHKPMATIYETSFKANGEPGEFRGKTVKSLYEARGGLPGVPDMHGTEPAELAVRASLFNTTYSVDFNAAGETAESLQTLYADVVQDGAKPAVADYLAHASAEDKADFKAVFGALNRTAKAASPGKKRTGHKFFT